MDQVPSFLCPECEFRGSNADELLNHIQVVHERGFNVSCSYCGYQAGSTDYLNRHIKRTHGRGRSSLKHIQPKRRIDKYKCDQCDFKAIFQYQLNTHNLSEHADDDTKYACNSCDFQTSYQQDMKTHVEKQHQQSKEGEKFGSEYCEYSAYTIGRLIHHQRFCAFLQASLNAKAEEQNAGKRFKCKWDNCTFTADVYGYMERHYQKHERLKQLCLKYPTVQKHSNRGRPLKSEREKKIQTENGNFSLPFRIGSIIDFIRKCI